jgi:tetratricopeptide (TPR) repeat protein
MLTTGGRVLLVDFGLASSEGSDAVTRSGSAIGSLPYMAPEQVKGRAELVGARTDLYGLGVTLYELLSLQRAFDARDSEELRAAIFEARPRSLRSLAPAMPRDLDALVRIAMAPEVDRRYASAADLARDLSHVLAREPIEARAAGAWVQLLRWTQRHPAAAALAVVVLFVGPSLFAWQQWRARELIRDQRDRADVNFQHALEAVDTMLARVGDKTLALVPRTAEVRRDLLEDALAFYGRFLEQSGDDPDVRLRGAITQGKVARIRRDLGRQSDADETYAAAEATLRELERRAPGDRGVRDALLEVLEERANVLHYLGCLPESEALHREVLRRAGDGLDAEPAPGLHHGRALAEASLQLAYVLRDRDRRREAAIAADRAIDEMRRIVYSEPESLQSLRLLAETLSWSAQLMATLRPDEEIARRYVESTELLRSLLATDPEDPILREALGFVLGHRGRFLSERHFAGFRPPGPSAEETLRSAHEIFERLSADHPRILAYQAARSVQSTNLCAHLARLGRFEEALPIGESAVAAFVTLAELQPGVC